MNALHRLGRRKPEPSPIPTRHDAELLAFLTARMGRATRANIEGLPLSASWDELEAHRLAQESAIEHPPALFA